jgi:3-dehydrotetronate 4-kinase
MYLGCIADDFTGATDLANNLVRSGMRVVQTIGVPTEPPPADVDAVVIALKTRTIAPASAVMESLLAGRWLRAQGARQFYFKVCSTFDSTDQGNIGPVTEALMGELGTNFVPICPAFPENQRTIFNGYLFVGNGLLSESSMRNHPLTPMHDSNLLRVMQRQCKRQVGLIDHRTVHAGSIAVEERIELLKQSGIELAIVDATSDEDLLTMGRAFVDVKLLVAGSGVALGLPQNFGIVPSSQSSQLPIAGGHKAIVSGSCSVASNEQVAAFKAGGYASFAIHPLRAAKGEDLVSECLDWAKSRLGQEPILVYATAEPHAVKETQAILGVQDAGELVEHILSSIATGLVAAGVGQLVVAGGETSGACVKALGIANMRIGSQIDPGVPWCYAGANTVTAHGLHIALKSGNFGTPDFFAKAFGVLK